MNSEDKIDNANQGSELKYVEIVRNSWTMILSIKRSTINLWTVSNPDEFIFPDAVTYGRKTPTA